MSRISLCRHGFDVGQLIDFSMRLQPQFFLENKIEIRNILRQLSIGLPSYKDLHWRLDVQVGAFKSARRVQISFEFSQLGSRCLRQSVQPVFTMEFHTKAGDKGPSFPGIISRSTNP